MKDVLDCEKPRGAVKELLIRGIPEWGNPTLLEILEYPFLGRRNSGESENISVPWKE